MTRHPIRSVPIGIVVVAVLAGMSLVTVPRAIDAQRPVATEIPATDRRGMESVLARLISVDLENVTVKQAVNALAQSAKARVQFRVLDLDAVPRRVSLQASRITLGDAFLKIFAGTSLQAVPFAVDVVTIESVTGTQLGDGIITGLVKHAKTGQPVAQATISVDNPASSAKTGTNGAFRMALPPGEYQMTVRAVGFGRVVKNVTIREGESSTLEIVLEPNASVLDEVIVTGTVVATERKAIPNPITVITADDIEQRGITRIEQFLRGEVPGVVAIEQGASVFQDRMSSSVDNLGGAVTARVYSRGSSGLDFAGGAPTPLKTFVDGVELLDGSYLGTIDPKSVERIEIVTGPQAATIYGSGAMGGVMQIFTKKGIAGRAPEYVLHLQYGVLENNLSDGKTPSHRHSLSVTGSDGPALSYSINVSYDYSGQWQPNVFNRRAGGSLGATYRRDKMTVNGSISTTGTKNGTMGWTSGATLSPKGRTMIESGQWNPVNTASAFSERLSTTSNQMVSVNADYRLSSEWQHHLTLGRSGNQFALIPEAPGFYTTTDTLYRSSTASGQRTSWSYNTTYATRVGKWLSPSLTMGANGSSASQTRSQGCLEAKTSTSYIGCTSTTAPNVTQTLIDNSWGGFGNFRVGFLDQLYVTLGLRAEKNPNYGKDHPVDWTPTNGITYTRSIGDMTVKLLASYGSATRPPVAEGRLETLEIQPAWDPSSFIRQFANPELRPEYSRGPQGGLELYYGTWGSVTINHYQQKVTDLLQWVPIDTFRFIYISTGDSGITQQYQWLNVGTVRQYGWEGTASVTVGSLNVKGTYSWNDSRILSNDPRLRNLNEAGRSFNNVLTHTGNVVVSYAHRNTRITASTNFVGKTITGGLDPFGDEYEFYNRALNRERMYYTRGRTAACVCTTSKPGYSKTDLALSHRITSWMSATLNMINVGNDYSSDVGASAGWPSLGRQTTLGVSLRYR